jgi:hypothetical protein
MTLAGPLRVAKATIDVIRRERKRRRSRLPDHPDAAYDQWLFWDTPFVNELCLLVLVAIHHQVERELIRMAAQKTDEGKPLSRAEYQEHLRLEHAKWKSDRKSVIKKLKLDSFPVWNRDLEALRQLANSYKHTASRRPDDKLLNLLQLDLKRNYAPLAESDGIREGLAVYLKLKKDADYCAIASKLLLRADRFLTAVKQQPGLSKVNWGRVSFHPKDSEH